jgi:hypothetical protein
MPSRTHDSKHWRNRAAAIRAVAATMQDTNAGTLMGDLAHDYDKFADKAERRAAQVADKRT